MPHLNNLHELYNNMIKLNEFASVFDAIYHRRPFRCIFLADKDNRDLFISRAGENTFTLHINIPNDFNLNSFFIDRGIYTLLVDYLELAFDPDNRFTPLGFIIGIEANFPTAFQEAPTERERYQTVRRTTKQYDGEKFFKGWIQWKSKHTSDDNKILTAALVGYKAAEKLQRNNISSAWSPYENEENLDALHEWARYIENNET